MQPIRIRATDKIRVKRVTQEHILDTSTRPKAMGPIVNTGLGVWRKPRDQQAMT